MIERCACIFSIIIFWQAQGTSVRVFQVPEAPPSFAEDKADVEATQPDKPHIEANPGEEPSEKRKTSPEDGRDSAESSIEPVASKPKKPKNYEALKAKELLDRASKPTDKASKPKTDADKASKPKTDPDKASKPKTDADKASKPKADVVNKAPKLPLSDGYLIYLDL